MKNKSVHSCRFVHQAKFHCIMTTLKKLYKIKFERGETGKEPNWDFRGEGSDKTLSFPDYNFKCG